jgi:hypothetical protein
MNKLVASFALSIILLQSSLSALLPPLYQSMEEFKALSVDRRLTDKFEAGESVTAITRFGDKFTVLTSSHKIIVDIVYEKAAGPGPAKFNFVFHDPQPR